MGDGFKCTFPGFVTRMFDGEQKIHFDTLTYMALDGARNFQNEDVLGDWRGFWNEERNNATSLELLIQPAMYDPGVNKLNLDVEVWRQNVSPAHLTLRTNHSVLDEEGISRRLMDALVTYEDLTKRQSADDPEPDAEFSRAAFTYEFKVRWSDLGSSGKASAPFMGVAAYDAVTAGIRANKFEGLSKTEIRQYGVRYMKLEKFADAEELQVIKVSVILAKKKCQSSLLNLPGRAEEADNGEKVTAIVWIADAKSGKSLSRIEFQFQTIATWRPWIQLKGEMAAIIEHP